MPEVKFRGHVDGSEREAAFQSASAVVLPTYSENFGNVVAEALIRGLPVMTTTGTPWSAVAELKLGWYVQPNVGDLRQALTELQATPDAVLRDMGARGRQYAAEHLSVAAVRERLLSMYRSAMGSALSQCAQVPAKRTSRPA
jgi:glycosyltransferase involved in cell wall biosynthesis